MSTTTRVFLVCGVPVRLADLSTGTAARLAWAREAGDTSSLARVLLDMADLGLRGSPLDDAAGHLRESLQLATRTGDATAGPGTRELTQRLAQQSYDPPVNAPDGREIHGPCGLKMVPNRLGERSR